MQRLWTLQEGLLARKLIFEFADGFVTLDELIPMGRGPGRCTVNTASRRNIPSH